jgi:hypothetical protein
LTILPGQKGLRFAVIDTPAGRLLITAMVRVLLVAGLFIVQVILEVSIQLT